MTIETKAKSDHDDNDDFFDLNDEQISIKMAIRYLRAGPVDSEMHKKSQVNAM